MVAESAGGSISITLSAMSDGTSTCCTMQAIHIVTNYTIFTVWSSMTRSTESALRCFSPSR
jgi:hypothetical protein